MGRTVAKSVETFKRAYVKRPEIKSAALAAGYAENTAKQGLACMPKAIRSFVLARQRKLDRLAELGKSVDASTQKDIVRGALLSNIAQGVDKSAQSIKMAGQDERVNIFRSDNQQGVIVVNLPDRLADALIRREMPANDNTRLLEG